MATPNLSELITTTQRHRSGKLADNMNNNTALLKRLKSKGNVKLISGGRTIVQELDYAENGTFMFYSGYEELDISPSEVLSAAEFDWKQASCVVSASGLEIDIQNAGKEQVIDLLEARIKNAERTMMNKMSTAIYSDGTAFGGKQIGGLQLLVSDTGTGTVGGINSSTFSFWRNIVFDATTDGGSAATSANIGTYMNRVWVQLVRNSDRPDLIMADNNYWRLYLESLQAIQRITTSDSNASIGFPSVKYMDADVVLDGGQGGACPANHMYFLNTDYIHFVTHRDRNFVPLPKRMSVNQDAEIHPVLWAGGMTVSNRALQGLLKD